MKNKYQQAIEAIQYACNTYKVTCKIHYNWQQLTYRSKEIGWTIETMDKRFCNQDFALCAAEAVGFILKSHGVEI